MPVTSCSDMFFTGVETAIPKTTRRKKGRNQNKQKLKQEEAPASLTSLPTWKCIYCTQKLTNSRQEKCRFHNFSVRRPCCFQWLHEKCSPGSASYLQVQTKTASLTLRPQPPPKPQTWLWIILHHQKKPLIHVLKTTRSVRFH